MFRLVSALLGAATMLVGSPAALSDAIKLTPADGSLQTQDLVNVADALGLRFEIFDYETAEPHCVHFFVDEIDPSGTATRHDGHGLCGRAGPQRLTIQWKAEGAELAFRFFRFRRDIKQGGSVSGPTIAIPEAGGTWAHRTEPPELAYGRETLLYHGVSGWNDGPRTEFKVLAELRRNPDGAIGTERLRSE